MLYILIAIIVFGILIAVHELGHFISAKLLGVKVNEFAIGMGPAIWKRQGRVTKYSLRALPIGGFCALEGEDEDSTDESSFMVQPLWKKIIILVAGSFMNFLVGFIIVAVLFLKTDAFIDTTLHELADPNVTTEIKAGDRILKIDGERIYLYSDITTFLSRGNGETYDIVVERDGERLKLEDVPLSPHEFEYNGVTKYGYGLLFEVSEATFGNRIEHAWYNSIQFVRLVRLGLTDLISGAVGVKELSGPVGIVSIISDVGENSASASDAAENIAYLCAFIAINLAVMNMLPIPALDGGRIFLLIITTIIEKVIRRRVNPKITAYIHATGFALLIGLMVFVMFNDIIKIIRA